jgi:hypothetical protein
MEEVPAMSDLVTELREGYKIVLLTDGPGGYRLLEVKETKIVDGIITLDPLPVTGKGMVHVGFTFYKEPVYRSLRRTKLVQIEGTALVFHAEMFTCINRGFFNGPPVEVVNHPVNIPITDGNEESKPLVWMRAWVTFRDVHTGQEAIVHFTAFGHTEEEARLNINREIGGHLDKNRHLVIRHQHIERKETPTE